MTCAVCDTPAPDGATDCATCGAALGPAHHEVGAPATAATAGDTRTWAMAAHLTALGGALLGGLPAFIGPLVIMLLKRDDDPFVAHHAKESLNFQLFTLLCAVVAFVFTVLTFGLGALLVVPVGLVAGIAWLVFVIMATARASSGEPYRYPITIRFIS